MLKVIVGAVILAILGILYIVYNRHDAGMVNFGWVLVGIGALVAGVFTYLAFKGKPEEPEPEPEPKAKGRRKRKR